MFLAMALHPLHRAFGVRRVFVSTMQAVSGAGYPGVASLDILGNVIPDISGEAEKMENETRKILGDFEDGAVRPAAMALSAMTHRVPVEDGHLEAVSAGFDRPASAEEVERAWEEFRGPEAVRALPSAPRRPLVYVRDAHRPQPRRDVDTEDGMAAVIGGLDAMRGPGLEVPRARAQHGARGRGRFSAQRGVRRGPGAAGLIVQKFGGTSLENAGALERVAAIVAAARALDPVLVVSALGHTTDGLVEALEAAESGNEKRALSRIARLQRETEEVARRVLRRRGRGSGGGSGPALR